MCQINVSKLFINMATKRKVVRSTQAQLKFMVDYMSTNPKFAVAAGEYSGPLGTQKMEAEWVKLKDLLTARGPEKSIEQWKHSWRDLKKRARDEVGRALYARGVTGTDPDPPKLSEMSEKILASIAKDAIIGIEAEEDTIGGTVLDEEPWVAEPALDESSSSASMETDAPGPPGPGSSTPRRRRTSIREGPMTQYLLLEGVENLPTFTTHRTSENARMDPLSVEKINESKTELETFEAPRKRPRAERSVFSYVKKPVTHPTKIIRIEIHDADSFPNAEQSMCNCHAQVCVQYAVKGSRFEDNEVYSSTMEIISKIQRDLESRS